MRTQLKKTSPRQALRFSPTAWTKLQFLRDFGETEIGGFGITRADDLLFVEDVQLVRQTCSWVHVEFDDAAVADFFDTHVDRGLRPEQFARIWIHTHPGNAASPSGTDEATFNRVFGSANWAVMFILARGGQTYCRMRFNVGPCGQSVLPVEVDFGNEFSGSDQRGWRDDYLTNIQLQPANDTTAKVNRKVFPELDVNDWWRDAWSEYEFGEELPEEEAYGFINELR